MTALQQARPDEPPVAPLRCYSFLDPDCGFQHDVRAGLSMRHKLVPPRWSFDARGLRLYAALTESPEFYAARTELAILQSHAAEACEYVGPDAQLIGMGAGGLLAIHYLILQLRPALYLQLDVDAVAVGVVTQALAEVFPRLNMAGLVADATRPLVLPGFVGVPVRRKVVLLPGWTLGSLTEDELFAALQQARRMVGPGGVLLAGVGLKKMRKVLDASCNDVAGAMAAFNAHVFERINSDLDGDLRFEHFRHLAFYDEVKGRVEMFMESQVAQVAHAGGQRYAFEAGEAVLTGIMCKYSNEEFLSLASEAGFTSQKLWTDDARQFSVHGMTVG